MRIPSQPPVKELTHLSPSLYEAARLCKARAAWIAFGDRNSVPHHPRALLGTCVHSVVEEGHKGHLPPGDEGSRLAAARAAFDRKAKELHAVAHPLLREKFPTPDRIPYYYLFRERAVVLALATQAPTNTEHAPVTVPTSPVQSTLAETTLTSRDGLLVGRPDYVDPAAGEVVDYKTRGGPEDDPDGLRDSEARQLRLYVHLGRERGLTLRRGLVVRVDGRRIALDVAESEAVAEGQRARETLSAYNARASESFKDLAEPSADACRYCPCIPFCESFWQAAAPTWVDCGSHIEGTISGVNKAIVQNTALLTLELGVERGTVAPGPAVLQHLPQRWACVDGAPPPEVGDVVRVVNCRLADQGGDIALIRPDRLTTAIWIVRTAADAS